MMFYIAIAFQVRIFCITDLEMTEWQLIYPGEKYRIQFNIPETEFLYIAFKRGNGENGGHYEALVPIN